jgi:hypothetical protein
VNFNPAALSAAALCPSAELAVDVLGGRASSGGRAAPLGDECSGSGCRRRGGKRVGGKRVGGDFDGVKMAASSAVTARSRLRLSGSLFAIKYLRT